MSGEVARILGQKLKSEQLKIKEPMSGHTSFKVGGPADVFVTPQDAGEFSEVVSVCKTCGVPFFILGNGSNVLVSDSGVRGVVVSTAMLDGIELLNDGGIKAGAGATLRDIAGFAFENGLTGFEFASGIPGSLGGAVFMNAGAYDREVGDVFYSADVLEFSPDTQGFKLKKIFCDEMEFGYRRSAVQKRGLIIVCAEIRLERGSKETIRETMDELAARRSEKQPIDLPSAGSAFKRPPGRFAAKLIADSGLRGYRVGGAQVSEKHCGFIVNTGNATAKDILDLIAYVQKIVGEKQGVWLEPEIRVLG